MNLLILLYLIKKFKNILEDFILSEDEIETLVMIICFAVENKATLAAVEFQQILKIPKLQFNIIKYIYKKSLTLVR